ncbi:MAG TPA: hypothetical protein VIM12_01190 [Noviherbaspirillum sp.]|jgi:hypothetical protein|uniref:hypothetical protein n=1 Tax=Noviherbaspirillum sp. TaxID=1926288 RepID=UPI002F9509A4
MTKIPPLLAAALAAALLSGCSPTYDWREIRGDGAPYLIMLPSKPASHTRAVVLDGTEVQMTMTGAEADDVSFTVATAELPDAAQAQKTLQVMKSAMVRNIGGSVKQEKPVQVAGTAAGGTEVTAVGAPDASGRARMLAARFFVLDRRVFQLVVLGPEGTVPQEALDTFFASFKPT